MENKLLKYIILGYGCGSANMTTEKLVKTKKESFYGIAEETFFLFNYKYFILLFASHTYPDRPSRQPLPPHLLPEAVPVPARRRRRRLRRVHLWR